MIVAIDGPAGAGKSTVARALAERLGFRHLDTGAMHRSLARLPLHPGKPPGRGGGAATDLKLRDQSDRARMQPAADAERIDTTELDVDEVVARIEGLVRARSAV